MNHYFVCHTCGNQSVIDSEEPTCARMECRCDNRFLTCMSEVKDKEEMDLISRKARNSLEIQHINKQINNLKRRLDELVVR